MDRALPLSLRIFFAVSLLVLTQEMSQPGMATPLGEDSLDLMDDPDVRMTKNLTSIVWAHAVNSKQQLKDAFANDTIQMIEADVVLGSIAGSDKSNTLPIMAHPPNTTSDLSFDEFLKIVQNETLRVNKGIKLDFKSTEAFGASMDALTNFFTEIESDIPVILNADILPGPGARDIPGVNATLFLSAAVTRFPLATVSVGWTTRYNTTDNKYLPEDIDNMTEILNKNCVVQKVTFAVRAAYVANSADVLKNLIESSADGTTLTIWNSSPSDVVDMIAVKKLIDDIGSDKVYLDLSPFINAPVDGNDGSQLLSKCALVAATTLLAFGISHAYH